MPAHIIIIVIVFIRSFVDWPDEYWDTYVSLFCSSIFATLTNLCILEIGTKFYITTQEHILLYSIVIIFLILSNVMSLIGIFLVCKYKNQLIIALFSIHYALFIFTACLSCTYSFSPIFSSTQKSG